MNNKAPPAPALPRLAPILLLALSACSSETSNTNASLAHQPTATGLYRTTASIQDLMLAEIDPSADALWAAVATTDTADGVHEDVPRTDAEWLTVRHNALVLVEATNLLLMEGRHVATVGRKLEDAHLPGILAPEQIEVMINADRASFVTLAHGLHDAGSRAIDAADAKDPAALLEAGNLIDGACEKCHLKYWYPEQQPTKN